MHRSAVRLVRGQIAIHEKTGLLLDIPASCALLDLPLPAPHVDAPKVIRGLLLVPRAAPPANHALHRLVEAEGDAAARVVRQPHVAGDVEVELGPALVVYDVRGAAVVGRVREALEAEGVLGRGLVVEECG